MVIDSDSPCFFCLDKPANVAWSFVTSPGVTAYYKVVTYSYRSRGAGVLKKSDYAKCRENCYMDAQGPIRRRLMDLGFVPGTEVEIIRRRPGRGAAVYLLRGTMIVLRKEQSEHIFIELIGADTDG
jgi:ferrous iron transport protein A